MSEEIILMHWLDFSDFLTALQPPLTWIGVSANFDEVWIPSGLFHDPGYSVEDAHQRGYGSTLWQDHEFLPLDYAIKTTPQKVVGLLMIKRKAIQCAKESHLADIKGMG